MVEEAIEGLVSGDAVAAASAAATGIVDVEGIGPVMTLREESKSLGDMEDADAMASAADAMGVAAPGAAMPPSERIPTIPVAAEAATKKKYSPNEIFMFHPDAATSTDKLKSGYKDGGRWLAPYAPFPIMDGDIEYPTMEHYMAAMKYKFASNSPESARGLFGRDGQIHNDFLQKRLVESGGRPLSAEKDQEFLKKETEMVKLRSGQGALNKVGFNPAKWAIVKDKVIEEAIQQRMTRDAKFKKIVDAAKAQGVYLLYYTGSTGGSELGGVRRPDETIDGDNRVGKTIMRLAGYSA
jgi:predicted NAD-dependent protein-ADP-ribosyltransferase YbiA (DUF1768 family)